MNFETLTKENSKVAAMSAIFDLHEAITDGELCVQDLEDVMRAAVAEGYDMLMISVAMVQVALKRAREARP